MKKTMMLFVALLLIKAAVAQTKYAFAYAYSSSDKTLYISTPVFLGDYANCASENGYNSKIEPEKCVERSFTRLLKIETGSHSSTYTIRVSACKYENGGYDCKDVYATEAEAREAILTLTAKYREQDYDYHKVNLK